MVQICYKDLCLNAMKFDFNKVKQYFREVSVVIVGIVITFVGSGLISDWEKKKEVKTVMGLIREEINDNIDFLEYSISAFQRDSLLFSYLAKSEEAGKEIPLDSLKQIKSALSSVRKFWYKRDAFELLKSASLMQHVKDKELLFQVIKSYQLLEVYELSMNEYTNYKYRIMIEPFETLSKDQRNKIWKEENTTDFFQFILNDTSIWSFIDNAPGFLAIPLNSFPPEFHKVAGLLDKKYKFRKNS